MQQIKVKGIVVHEEAKGEQDKTLMLLTDTIGTIYVKAPGVRKLSASNMRSAQLFAFSDFLLYEKGGYYTLQEASLIEDFYAIREDVSVYALACYLCEVASSVSIGGEEGAEILRLLLNALYAAEKHISSLKIIKSSFEFRLMALIGYEPELSMCPLCGTPAGEIKEKMFELAEGYVFCASCENPEEGFTKRKRLSESSYQAMIHMLSSPVNKVFLFRLDNASLEDVSSITEDFLLLRLEKKVKTLDFLNKCLKA